MRDGMNQLTDRFSGEMKMHKSAAGSGKRFLRALLLLFLIGTVLISSGCGSRDDSGNIPIKPDGEDHPVSEAALPETDEGDDDDDDDDDDEDAGAGSSHEENTAGDGSPGLVYLIVPSEEGTARKEMVILTQAAKEAGADIVILNYMNDPIAEANAIEQAVRENANLIICDNIDEIQTVRGIKSAKEKNIPVMLLGRGIETLGMASFQILTESYTCVRKMGERYAGERKKGGAYVMLRGDNQLEDLAEAFSSVILRYTGIKELESVSCDERDAMAAYDTAWELLNAHKNADTVICGNSVQTQAAVDAAADLSLSPQILCLSGDTDLIVDYVEEGKVHAAIVKPTEALAEEAAKRMKDYFETGEMPLTECYYIAGEIRMEESNQ